jgi:hypothetical protein
MKLSRFWRRVILVAAFAVAISVALLVQWSFNLTRYECEADGEIAQDERGDLEQVGLRFVQAVVSNRPDDAYAMMTAHARETVTSDAIKGFVEQVQSLKLSNGLKVDHAYLVEVHNFIGKSLRTTCNLSSRKDDWIAVATPGPKQAYVLVHGDSTNNGWTFILWLVPDQGWQVEHAQFQMTAAAGKGAEDVWALAREQRDRNHPFNAVLLYALASELAQRGPNFQLGILPKIGSEMSKLPMPSELQGNAPFTWRFGSSEYKIRKVTVTGIGGKLYIDIMQEIPPWTDDTEADRENRKLINEFKQAVPEHKDVFELTVTAWESGRTRGYRTGDDAP